MRVAILTSVRPHTYGFINHLLSRNIEIVHVVFEGGLQQGMRVRLLTAVESIVARLAHRLFLRRHSGSYVDRWRHFGDVFALLTAHGISWDATDNHNNPENVETLAALKPDLLILAGTRIIKEPLLKVPATGTLNTHSALLPRFRGAKTEFWILYREELDAFGVTVHWVNPGLDTGAIVLQERVRVEPDDTPSTLRQKANWLAPILLAEAIRRMDAGEELRTPQDNAKASTCTFPTPQDVEAYRAKFPGRPVF